MSEALAPQRERRLYHLLEIVAPMLAQARDQLVSIDRVAELFHAPLLDRIVSILDQTLVFELCKAKLRNELDGDSSYERFDSFTRSLATVDTRDKFHDNYPVLVCRLERVISTTTAFARTFCASLERDRRLLKRSFSAGKPLGAVQELEMRGDPHCGGKCVLVVRFASGTRVVYKPRPLALEAGFQQLLDWLNRQNPRLAFSRLVVCDRETYGWMEFAVATPCADGSEAKRYYWRLGALVALAHTLGTTDLHHENLVAIGEDPVIVDLETLLQPRNRLEVDHSAGDFASNMLRESVIETGLVPVWNRSGYDVAGPDISGLGANPGTQTVPVWEAEGTDQMHVALKRVPVVPGASCPTLSGVPLNPLDYVTDIEEGFTAMTRLLIRHRAELIDEKGPLRSLFNARVRVILRDTDKYARFLRGSRHPRNLRCDRDLNEWMAKLRLVLKEHPELEKAITFEKRDLLEDDIPYFTAAARGRDLISS